MTAAPDRRRVLPRLAALVVISAAAYFFTATLVTNWDRLGAIELSPDRWTVLGMLLFASSVPVAGLGWRRIIERLADVHFAPGAVIEAHTTAWLLKYVPGQVGALLYKLHWAARRGVSVSLTTVSYIYENVFVIFVSVLPPLAVLLLSDDSGSGTKQISAAALILILPLMLIMKRSVMSRVVNTVLRLIRKPLIDQALFLGVGPSFIALLWFLLSRILLGLGFAAICTSMIEVEAQLYPVLVATYVVAGIAGMLALFVPSGLGVREAVIVTILVFYVPLEHAVVLSLVARFYATLADILLLSWLAIRAGHGLKQRLREVVPSETRPNA